MRYQTLFLILLFPFNVTAEKNIEALHNHIGCWQNVSKKYGHKVTFCVNRDRATSSVYYPNDGHDSTFCSQFGYSTGSQKKNVINFNFMKGTCKNGRKLDPDKLACKLKNNRQLNCKSVSGYSFELSPFK